MIYGPAPLGEARGAILAHAIPLNDRVLKAGSVLDHAAIAALEAAGHAHVVVARPEAREVPADEAAHRLADAVGGPLLARSRASAGRVELSAESAGLLVVDAAAVDRVNLLDEALTIATLASHVPVATGEKVAAVRVIPLAVPERLLEVAEALARQGSPLLSIHPFRPLRVGLVLTELPGMKGSVPDGRVAAMRERVQRLGGTLLPPERCRHEVPALAETLARLRRAGAQLLVIAGASAVMDRRDVGPTAIMRAGGAITHFGMPADPGGRLCLGQIDDIPAIILPDSADTPGPDGLDQVLWRLFAGLPVQPEDIMRMGVGGLRRAAGALPSPRGQADGATAAGHAPYPPRKVAALVLAAGRSSRMAPRNKLLVPDDLGVPMVARVVDNVLASRARPVVVVTGHERERVEAILAGRPVRFVHAEAYAEGLSASLKAGLAALPPDAEGVVVCLGDMPLVTGAVIDRLIAAFDPAQGRAIVLPSFRGKRGNPVLWSTEFLPEMMRITGDTGARQLIRRHSDRLAEVEMADDAVLRDFDTAETLKTAPGFAGVK